MDILSIVGGGWSSKGAKIEGIGIRGGVRTYWKEHKWDEGVDGIGNIVDGCANKEGGWG